MLNQADLAQTLSERVKRGKDSAFLFRFGEQAFLSSAGKRFEVIEYFVSITDQNGHRSLVRGNQANQPAGNFILIADDKGPEGNCVRFVLYEGDVITKSSLDVANAFVWIILKLGASMRAHVVSFVISSQKDETKSALIIDTDSSLVQFCMLAPDWSTYYE